MSNALAITPAARADIDHIWSYGAATWGVAKADLYLDAMEETVRRIVDMPRMARVYPRLGKGIRAIPCGVHMIVYSFQADVVTVLRILSARQGWQNVDLTDEIW
jgi:toxin ParE1/3/4